MKNIILLGAPGSGKGTQAGNIANWYGIQQVSTGEIFRTNINAGTELGKLAKQYIGGGRLVPDDLTIELVKTRIMEATCNNGFILDGFPRTVYQAEALDKFLAEENRKIDVVANIQLSDETVVTRLSGRRLCAACGKSYHIAYNPPAVEGVCDKCGGKIVSRDDDNEETIRNRLIVYHRETAPLIERYKKQGIFVQVTSHELIEDTTSEMKAALINVFGE